MPVRVRRACSFPATDALGRRYTLEVYRGCDEAGAPLAGGLSSIWARGGDRVDRVEEARYRVCGATGPGSVLTSDDPDAP